MAATIPISKVVEKAANVMGDHIRNLYGRVKTGYNKYVKLLGGAIGAGACAAIKQGNDMDVLKDNTPLLYYLTGAAPFSICYDMKLNIKYNLKYSVHMLQLHLYMHSNYFVTLQLL